MKKLFLLAAALIASLTAPASAATIALSPTASYSVTTGIRGTDNTGLISAPMSHSNTAILSLPKATVSMDGARIADRFTGSAQTPNTVYGYEHYLTVFGNNNEFHRSGSATFTFTQPASSVSFNWGSVEDYNSLIVTNELNEVVYLNGANIRAAMNAPITNDVYFTLTDLAGIKKIVFASTYNSFEVANLSVQPVPLPGALLFFSSGLVGLTSLSRKKKA